jgi:TonB-dependent SusC/RagA subfamily outer membrane receptor
VASAQTDFVVLSGKVVDSADGYPLIGVSVSVAGTRQGTVTDIDGLYQLKVPRQQCEVLFSYVGYDDKVISYNLKNTSAFSKVVMYTNVTQLADVVVTGVYERKKESFTGASATFKTDELKAVGTSNILQSLSTLDPSFKMMESSQFGSNPNVMPDIEIRGKTSVAGLKEEYGTDPNQPLFILDGFETSLETIMNLNMNRVASVTILKDAASTAIYGSKASNGVVVIETKAPARGRLQLS